MSITLAADDNELDLKITNQYEIGAGDLLEILIALPPTDGMLPLSDSTQWEKFGGTSFSKTVIRVDPNGMIGLPLIGQISVKSMSSEQATKVITRKLDRYIIDPQVTINILEYANYTIFVLGEVKNSGLYNPKREVRVLESIALAGGFTKFAAKNKVKIFRYENGERKTMEIDMIKIIKKRKINYDIILKSGDLVFVPERSF